MLGDNNKSVHKGYAFLFIVLGMLSANCVWNAIRYYHDLMVFAFFVSMSVLVGVGFFFFYQKAFNNQS